MTLTPAEIEYVRRNPGLTPAAYAAACGRKATKPFREAVAAVQAQSQVVAAALASVRPRPNLEQKTATGTRTVSVMTEEASMASFDPKNEAAATVFREEQARKAEQSRDNPDAPPADDVPSRALRGAVRKG